MKKFKILYSIVLLVFISLTSCKKSEDLRIDPIKNITNEKMNQSEVLTNNLPDLQIEFQKEVLNIPIIPANLVGTREEDAYVEQLIKLKQKWSSNVGEFVENWECAIDKNLQELRSMDTKYDKVICSPIGMGGHKNYSSITAIQINPQKFYDGDRLTVSGKIEDINIYQGTSNLPNRYDLYLVDANVSLKKKTQ